MEWSLRMWLLIGDFFVVENLRIGCGTVACFLFWSVDSTNKVARRFLEESVRPPFCVLAATQTAGRGRFDRRWESPSYGGIYLSYVCRADFEKPQLVTFAVALAVKDTVLHFAPNADLRVRYPNDVLVNGKKISGILAELIKKGLIIGVGLNQRQDALPAELKGDATALDSLGVQPSRYSLVRTLVENIDERLRRLASGGANEIIKEVERSGAVGCRVKVIEMSGEMVCGIAEKLDEDGALVVRTDDGKIHSIVAADVRFLRLKE